VNRILPKVITVLRAGYAIDDLRRDALAGLTVAIVALPLAMALAIASGTTPEKGLITAIVAGFLISALGGSRYQIGGPTGAFVVVVYNVIQHHGLDGLAIATLMAGAMLIAAGFLKVGSWIKYIPLPVITGFTAGIAFIIATSQIGELLGLDPTGMPGDVLGKLRFYSEHIGSTNNVATALSVATLGVIVAMRRWLPRAPGTLLAVVLASIAVVVFSLPVDTIGSRFGDVPMSLPAPRLPAVTLQRLGELLPSAFTIAFLAGVESLLSALVADGMSGGRHRSNTELVGQGVANCASALFGGLPATGAIARTATNVRAGARSPIAGMLHALFLLAFMLLLAPLVRYLPLAACAAVLLVVAWNMSEIERFRHLLAAPLGDRIVLLLTFGLTVAVDLTVAIEVGVVLASFLFMHRMAEAVRLQSHATLLRFDSDEVPSTTEINDRARAPLPKGVEYLELQGPFFFGVANLFADVIARIESAPRACVLVLREVPMIDASGTGALRDFAQNCRRHGTRLVLTELQAPVAEALERMGVLALPGVETAASVAAGLARAAEIASQAADGVVRDAVASP
jgi:SulP family sulfate permease